MRPRLDARTAGAALVAGYLVMAALLYRDPAAGLASATRSGGSVLYFIVFPALGVAAGGYAFLGGPHGGVAVFPAASYLGVVGLALALGGIAAPALALAGLLVFGLAAVALVAGLRSLAAALGVDL